MNNKFRRIAIKCIRRSIRSAFLIGEYQEKISERGFYEVVIFNMCCTLVKEYNPKIIEASLICLIQYLANELGKEFSEDDIALHVRDRSKIYTHEIVQVPKNIKDFDLRPLYSIWYRYPFEEIKFMMAEPASESEFRNIIYHMLKRSMSRSFWKRLTDFFWSKIPIPSFGGN